jgi:hypothetical protein
MSCGAAATFATNRAQSQTKTNLGQPARKPLVFRLDTGFGAPLFERDFSPPALPVPLNTPREPRDLAAVEIVRVAAADAEIFFFFFFFS